MNEPFKSVSNKEFGELLEAGNIQLVDVRTPEEFHEAHIPGAININVTGDHFDEKINELSKEIPVAVYCRSGARSKMAAQIMERKGFVVYELDNGIIYWDGETE